MKRVVECLLVLVPLVAGCKAERILRVTSDPPGATVRLDGEKLGTTPLTHEFLYYGVRRVTLRLDDYCTYSEPIALTGPWYGRFPMDIVSEVLVPVGWKDVRHLHVELIPGEEAIAAPELRSVFERVEALRRAGPEGPPELPPTRPRQLPPITAEELEALDKAEKGDGGKDDEKGRDDGGDGGR